MIGADALKQLKDAQTGFVVEMGDEKEYGSFAKFVWEFEPGTGQRPERVDYDTLVTLAQTPESKALAKTLKKRGFRFFGPTTAYAFMQSMGLVNDHLEGCATRKRVESARREFLRP